MKMWKVPSQRRRTASYRFMAWVFLLALAVEYVRWHWGNQGWFFDVMNLAIVAYFVVELVRYGLADRRDRLEHEDIGRKIKADVKREDTP